MLKTINPPKSIHAAPHDHHQPVKARYDAAQTHAGNEKHWKYTDARSAGAELSPGIRKIIRERSRYEVKNNSFASGIVDTLTTDTIGTGPRLQLLTGDTKLNRTVEAQFKAWCNEISLAMKLRTMRTAKTRDGEAFGLLGTNNRLRHEVKLDFRCVEAEQFSDPAYKMETSESDGIEYDAWGNPISYSLLRSHPGSDYGYNLLADTIPAEMVVHYFTHRRPGQLRGVPDLTPALPLFAMLRRYTLAVVTAAEIAADMAGVIYTDAAADDEGYVVDPLDTIEIVRGMFTTMPSGWKMGQLKAEQPTQTYGEFRDKIVNEIARCLYMPKAIALGDSSDSNYASGRLDHQVYYRSIHVDRSEINHVALDHLWRAWLDEAALITGYLPREMRQIDADLVPHTWHWDGFEHVDPDKESKGEERNLRTGALTIPDLHARKGQDWEEQQTKQAAALGLSIEDYRKRLADYLLGPVPTESTEDEESEEEQEVEDAE